MTQTIVPATAPAVPAGAGPDARAIGGPAGRRARARAALGKWLEGSPGRLRVVAILAVLSALLLAVGGGASLRARSSDLDDAAKASGHLVLLQTVQTELQQVEADATNSSLSFGLEPQAQRLDYISTLAKASTDLITAGQNSPADAKALGAATAALTRYSGYIGEARYANLKGDQVGATYLGDASTLLNSDILPALQARVKADQHTVTSAYARAGHARWWLLLFALLGLGGLLVAQYYLALRSRRFLNMPLVGATVLALVVVLIGAGAMALSQSRANAVRSGALQRATDVSASRLAAFDAKSLESLTLVQEGQATSADTAWKQQFAQAKSKLPAGYSVAAQALDGYASQHADINTLAVSGNWKKAVSAATATGPGSANAEFAVFADQTAKAPTEQADEATSGLKRAREALLPAGLLILLAGLLAAAGAWWGVSLRLDEYR